ncbi:MAG: polysaccharide deacetylase family protein [Oscillospiraceae bacterium]|nr:polysaccharide deacetylase family protein [Oscillospiraceae bacterium]
MGSDLVSDIGDGLSDLGDGVSSLVSEIGEGVSDLTDGKDLTRSSQPAGALEDQPALETAAPVGDFSSLDGRKQGWGQGVQVDDQNRPLSPLTFQEKYGKYDAYFIGENEKVLYLTFDEGYENGYTPKILDTLKQKGVKAVFFVTLDYVKSQPELIQRMIDEGHMVGNHSDKHPCFPEVDAQRREQEIRNVDQYMADNFGYTSMNLFRPPAGEFSEQVLAQMQAMGYKTVFWSYAYKDWDPDHQMGAAKALEKVTGALHNGAIYLLHAVSKDNADILGDFIDTAQKQGYEFKLFS